MTPLDIQYALKRKGLTQHQIADDQNVSDMSISDVINKNIVSNRLMRAVAAAIGKDVRQVFPEYYLRPPQRKTSKVCRAA